MNVAVNVKNGYFFNGAGGVVFRVIRIRMYGDRRLNMREFQCTNWSGVRLGVRGDAPFHMHRTFHYVHVRIRTCWEAEFWCKDEFVRISFLKANSVWKHVDFTLDSVHKVEHVAFDWGVEAKDAANIHE